MLVSEARISFARLWCGWVVHIRLFIAKSLPLSIRNRKRFVPGHPRARCKRNLAPAHARAWRGGVVVGHSAKSSACGCCSAPWQAGEYQMHSLSVVFAPP